MKVVLFYCRGKNQLVRVEPLEIDKLPASLRLLAKNLLQLDFPESGNGQVYYLAAMAEDGSYFHLGIASRLASNNWPWSTEVKVNDQPWSEVIREIKQRIINHWREIRSRHSAQVAVCESVLGVLVQDWHLSL